MRIFNLLLLWYVVKWIWKLYGGLDDLFRRVLGGESGWRHGVLLDLISQTLAFLVLLPLLGGLLLLLVLLVVVIRIAAAHANLIIPIVTGVFVVAAIAIVLQLLRNRIEDQAVRDEFAATRRCPSCDRECSVNTRVCPRCENVLL